MYRQDLVKVLKQAIEDQNSSAFWSESLSDEMIRINGDLDLGELADEILKASI